MPTPDQGADKTRHESAYFLWEREGRPEGRALSHWLRAADGAAAKPDQNDEHADDEEKVLAGRTDANIPAMLTKDVPGG